MIPMVWADPSTGYVRITGLYNTRTLRSNTKNLIQIPLTNLKRFGDRAFCAYAPRLWNELHDNTKAADSVQNFKKQLKTLLFRKEFNWLYGPWQLSNDSKALLNIIGGKGAISNINYYYYYWLTGITSIVWADPGRRVDEKRRPEQ